MAKTMNRYDRKTDSPMNKRRQRLRDAGLVCVQVWVKPKNKDIAQALCEAHTVRVRGE